ncbi:hypothetical protein [uncultured Parabacteroides sp.]|uniref:Cas10/Cmr2 second palm domain-containing protein n=1 Tax=uncultured Parabacteroides sp. TaxID=512312 RepID=UPI0025DEC391|nr:hypothetical protein [uncultured Parabacteroides sp.]
MGKKRYLYGAAVQGIQEFIFQTNELKDIVGASELVEMVCTSAFDDYADLKNHEEDPNSIVRAAGNIKYEFDEMEKCRKAVREFPKKVQSMAPGITISQAVVELKEGNFDVAVDELENKLRIQRNYPMRSSTWGMLGVRRSRKTGLPAVIKVKDDYLDDATFKKRKDRGDATVRVCEKAFGAVSGTLNKNEIAFDIEEMTNLNDWIAIIHADGNGLGQVIQKIGRNKEELAKFSKKLDELTRQAAVKAYEDTMKEDVFSYFNRCIPVRPIVLSGDDLTVIIRGDLALTYAESFLRHFEEVTVQAMSDIVEKGKGLTACAGIAFIKSSYPFYYGYELAEALCGRAKKRAKEINSTLAPSCLMFHKVQDSFVESYDEIVKRELMPCDDVSFEFGPYFLKEQKDYWKISELKNNVTLLDNDEGNAVKSHLRQWLSIMHNGGKAQAVQKRKRLMSMLDSNSKLKTLTEDLMTGIALDKIEKYPVYDVLALHSVNSQVTRK